MTHHSLFASGVLVLALALPVAASAQQGGRLDVPEIPANLIVEDGHVPYLQTRAYGTQNYVCLPAATGVAWKLFGPQATLYPGNVPFQIATHFLSPNPDEQGLPRATWQHSHDGSAVWARAIQSSTDPNYVRAGAIPWLLLETVGTADGTIGGSPLAPKLSGVGTSPWPNRCCQMRLTATRLVSGFCRLVTHCASSSRPLWSDEIVGDCCMPWSETNPRFTVAPR